MSDSKTQASAVIIDSSACIGYFFRWRLSHENRTPNECSTTRLAPDGSTMRRRKPTAGLSTTTPIRCLAHHSRRFWRQRREQPFLCLFFGRRNRRSRFSSCHRVKFQRRLRLTRSGSRGGSDSHGFVGGSGFDFAGFVGDSLSDSVDSGADSVSDSKALAGAISVGWRLRPRLRRL